ncbi:hypothetical protein ACFL6U_15025, partial [Planctomycetota bacterium]
DEVDRKLQQIDGLWPYVNRLNQAKKDLAKLRDTYTEQIYVAKKAQTQKDLEPAMQASKAALSICPKSQEAQDLTESIDKAQSKTRNHLRSAKTFLRKAEFDKAHTQVKKARYSWITLESVGEMELEINAIIPQFRKEMAAAERNLKMHSLSRARACCNQALQLCPGASSAQYLIDKINGLEKQKKKRREHVKEVAASTGKWTGIIIGIGIALAVVAIMALFFWRWVTDTVCPWFVANPGTHIFWCCVLSVLQGIIHASRNTDTWIEASGGVFLVPLVITGVIVLISVLLAVFSIGTSWQNGTAVGLVIGLLVCGFAVVFSCVDD